MTNKITPTFPKVADPDYVEPPTVDSYRARLGNVGASATFSSEVADEYQAIAAELIARIDLLESALMPFATHAMALANMQMCLTAANRPNEPPGGTWLNGIKSANMQANPLIFYLAADAIGRAKVEQRMLNIFNKVQEAQNAAAEKTAHLENKTLAGPLGGPITGRTH